IGKGALYGAISGAVGGAVGAAGIGNDILRITAQVAAAGVTSGVIAELTGGRFSQGAIPAMITALLYGIGDAIERSNAGKGITLGENLRKKSSYSLKLNISEEAQMNYMEWAEKNSVQLVENASDAGVKIPAVKMNVGQIVTGVGLMLGGGLTTASGFYLSVFGLAEMTVPWTGGPITGAIGTGSGLHTLAVGGGMMVTGGYTSLKGYEIFKMGIKGR
ncbi:MAG: hypothetical protein AB1414_19505, partial [bacterium]